MLAIMAFYENDCKHCFTIVPNNGADFFIIGQYFKKQYNRKSFWTHQYSTAVADTYGGGGGGQLPQKCQICTMQQM